MSRICVKNLPRYVAEDRLREFFSEKGEVTDAKIMRTKDGKSRQFAFIGFRTEREAEEAIKFFNNSYLDTCRIACEVARKVGDPNIPRPWSRHSTKKEGLSTEEDGKNLEAKSSNLSDSKGAGSKLKKSEQRSENNDPQLQEFLQIMQPRSKSKLWANDTLGAPQIDQNGNVEGRKNKSHKGGKMQIVEMKVELEDGNDDRENELGPRMHNDLARDEVISDMDYFKSRVKKAWSDSESDDDSSLNESLSSQGGDEVDANEASAAQQGEPHDKSEEGFSEDPDSEKVNSENPSSKLGDVEELAFETGRLFVRNLPYTANEDDLVELFSQFGDVSQVHVVVDKDTKRSKGIGYVLYTLPESAVRALEELDNSIFQGRLLHVMPAKQQKYSSEKLESSLAAGQASKSFKQKREEERKKSEASGDSRAWNSLFMRPDTVVENIARKYGVSKSDLLDREADDVAVRIALGETHVIAETKKALANAGVNIAALEEFASGKTDNVRRSNHVVLVKNLPYGSSEGDLATMFGKFGSLDKIILPSTKTLALVIFLEAAEARAAFKGLAYKRLKETMFAILLGYNIFGFTASFFDNPVEAYLAAGIKVIFLEAAEARATFKGLAYKRLKDAPLYLEWAPDNILSPNLTSETDPPKIVGEQDVKRILLEQRIEEISEVDIDPDRVESRSLFVKNLNFKTSEECLKKHFNQNMEGRIQSVKIKKHLKNGMNVSMGFGFIEFDSMETAANTCRDLQGTILEGHALILQLCHTKKDEKVLKTVDKDRSSTKLIVRNVAFEATEKDLRQLFSPFGQIRSLRLPMKFGSHRGFAFVDYVTKQEAQNALQALSSTHLYGRHLVIERAKEGESLEELRARTAAQFTDEQSGFQNPSKLSKKRKHLAIVDEGNIKFERIAD